MGVLRPVGIYKAIFMSRELGPITKWVVFITNWAHITKWVGFFYYKMGRFFYYKMGTSLQNGPLLQNGP